MPRELQGPNFDSTDAVSGGVNTFYYTAGGCQNDRVDLYSAFISIHAYDEILLELQLAFDFVLKQRSNNDKS